MNMIAEFGRVARDLSRNPLGIIALFIVLVYGIAGAVFGSTAATLTPEERTPLIWFVVLLPAAVLGTFYRLVAKHHMKLYAPRDFRDPSDFFRTLTPSESMTRLQVEALEEKARVPELPGSVDGASNVGILEGYLLAESLVMRQLEFEFKVPARRNVVVGDLGVDGVFSLDSRSVIVEIKFTRATDWPTLVKPIIARMDDAHLRLSASGAIVSFILAIVTDGLSDKTIGQELAKVQFELGDAKARIDLRHYELKALLPKRLDFTNPGNSGLIGVL